MCLYDLAYLRLLDFHGKRRVDHRKAEFRNHFFVFVDDAPLEQAEAFRGIVAQADVEPGFVEFESVAGGHEPPDGRFERDAEVKMLRPAWRRRGIQIAGASDGPCRGLRRARTLCRYSGRKRTATHCLQQRKNVFVQSDPARKIRGVNERERRRCEHFLFLAPDLVNLSFTKPSGRVPLAENDAVAFGLKPLVKEAELRRFAGSIDAFDDEKPSREVRFASMPQAR